MRVVVPTATASAASTQHLAWLLITMLTRSATQVVKTIELVCPPDSALKEHVSPYPADDGTLRSTLLRTTELAGPDASPIAVMTEAITSEPDITIILNATSRSDTTDPPAWYATGARWRGTLSPTEPPPDLDFDSTTPFGPYVAACLAAGSVFLAVRATAFEMTAISVNAWDLSIARPEDASEEWGPENVVAAIDAVLAGVGAVGSAALLTLWAYQSAGGTIQCVDADDSGIESTNLNRCLPFNADDLGKLKAETAARALQRPGLNLAGIQDRAENHVTRQTRLISAVDTKSARAALQEKYPAATVQASTYGLRLEMLRVDPTQGGACLRCFNAPDLPESDVQLRARLEEESPENLTALERERGEAPGSIAAWIQDGACGTITATLLSRLRAPASESIASFSVGFVSVLAGVLLASQVVRDTQATPEASAVTGPQPHGLTAERTRFVVSLLNPSTVRPGVRPYRRDPNCPACAEGIRRNRWLSSWSG